MEVHYGQWYSERDNPKYKNTHHFFVLIEREGFHLSAEYTNYSYSCHFSDVGIHYHREENDGEKCSYSPTGFCNCYDQIKWVSFDNKISDYIATEILIEKISEALQKNGSTLERSEKEKIRWALQSFEYWEDKEK